METRHTCWSPPPVDLEALVLGDMPGDKIEVKETHIRRAEAVFPIILDRLPRNPEDGLVVSVYGGSGAGKSEIGSVLAYYCKAAGFPAYVMSGDNYPLRYPSQNDDERLTLFREAGLAAITQDEAFADAWDSDIHAAWPEMADADPSLAQNHRGFGVYQSAGRKALEAYLGTQAEIDFDLVNSIIKRFKSGVSSIPLKRMGRSPYDVHFKTVDFSETQVLLIEWTHGNNPLLRGVDLPIFLYSTPEETLEHRRSRGREKDLDSSIVRLVLDIEQSLLNAQTPTAGVILGKDGKLISLDQFKRLRR